MPANVQPIERLKCFRGRWPRDVNYVLPGVSLISQIHKFVNLGSYHGCRAVNTARIQTVRLTAAVVTRSAVDLIIRTVSNPAQVVNGGKK
jgi:hypothetical protein